MSTDIVPFQFQGITVRTLVVNGQLCWVVVDTCKALGIEDARQVANRIKDRYRYMAPVTDSMGRERDTWVVNEPGLMQLIMNSRVPNAEPFQEWVYEEVLPQIRKTGSYSTVPKTLQQALRDHADALDALEQAEAEIEQAKPKVVRYDMLQRVDGGYNRWSVGRALGFDGQLWRFTDHLIRLNALEYGRRGRLSPTDEWIAAKWIEVRGEMTTVITEDGFKHLESLKLQ